jgi:hypothetical protein
MLEQLVANIFSSKCFYLKTGTVPVFTWHGTVSSLAWQWPALPAVWPASKSPEMHSSVNIARRRKVVK